MSRGRRGYALADLQRVARSGKVTLVTEALLGTGTETPAPAPEPVVVRGPQPLEPRKVSRYTMGEWEEWHKPVDWPYRTTPQDVLDDACDLARERLPLHLSVLVEAVAEGDKRIPMSGQERGIVEAMIRKCRVQVMKELPKVPGRKKDTARMPVRTHGPCSPVVTKRPDGTFLLNGIPVTHITPECYEPIEA